MLNVDGLRIMITRGDTGSLTLRLKGEVPDDGTVAIVTLKRNVGNVVPEWVKRIEVVGGCIVIRLESEDTNRLPGDYWWDVRLLIGDDVITPCKPQAFNIVEVVGDV